MNKLFKIKNTKINSKKNFLSNFFRLILIIFTAVLIFKILKIFKIIRNNENKIIENFNTYNVIDSRIFFLNHKQWTSGINSLIKNTKNTNVTGFKISGFPLLWSEKHQKYFWYYESDFLLAQSIRTLPESNWVKFLPFISCINNSKYSYDHVLRLIEEHGKFWKGIGPIFINTKFNNQVNRYSMETDSHHLKRIINLATEKKMPIAIDFSFTEPGSEYRFDDILEPEDEISYNRDLYEDSTGLFDLFENYSDTKFIFYFHYFL